MNKLTELSQCVTGIFPEAKERDISSFARIRYPRVISFLKMNVKSYDIPGFGFLMSMDTSMMGLMKLSTFSFTPSSGMNIPFLLIDTMSMGKKRLAYVEFYDCRENKEEIISLTSLAKEYKHIENYQEKETWYVRERMEGSLIKCASGKDESILVDMVLDALKRYKNVMDNAGHDETNLPGLRVFAGRMLNEGNPSSSTLNTVLGKEKAEEFFHKIIMPLDNQ